VSEAVGRLAARLRQRVGHTATIAGDPFPPTCPGTDPSRVAVGDVDGDGVADGGSRPEVFGGTTPVPGVRTGPRLDGAVHQERSAASARRRSAVGDTDGDGRGEIVLGLTNLPPPTGCSTGCRAGFRYGRSSPTRARRLACRSRAGEPGRRREGRGSSSRRTGVAPLVRVFNGDGSFRSEFLAFNPSHRAGRAQPSRPATWTADGKGPRIVAGAAAPGDELRPHLQRQRGVSGRAASCCRRPTRSASSARRWPPRIVNGRRACTRCWLTVGPAPRHTQPGRDAGRAECDLAVPPGFNGRQSTLG